MNEIFRPQKPDRMPTKTMEVPTRFEIWNIDDLPTDERLAVLDAIEAYKGSTNSEFRAGACAVAINGEKSVKHNHTNEPGKGQEGHAEMLALDSLYETVNPADRRLKILALAASYPDQELIRSDVPYDKDTPIENINDIDAPHICGRCLKKISDYTGNNIPYSAETGKRDEPWDPTLLMVTGTGQVLRTRLSVVHPLAHIPHQIDIAPWNKKKTA